MHLIAHLRELLLPVPAQNAIWTEWATRLPPSAFIMWLAGYVANDLCNNMPRHAPPESIERVLSNASLMQRDAERFLRQTYFRYRPFCMNCQRMLLVFRHVVHNRIRRRFPN
jgi:hypothetical protein